MSDPRTRMARRWAAAGLLGLPVLLAGLAAPAASRAESHDTDASSEPQGAANDVAAEPPLPATCEGEASAPGASPAKDIALVYVPPIRGAPRGRIAGGVRSASLGPRVSALVPEHLAQTAQAAPAIFWRVEPLPDPGMPIVFTLIEAESVEPTAEIALPAPQRAGVQRLDLADHGLELEVGVDYEWSIALVVDPERRSRDAVTFGSIRRVPEPPDLATRGRCASSYAATGLWYDALAALHDELGQTPDDARVKAQWRALLRQAGLDDRPI